MAKRGTIDAGHGGIDPGATGLGYKEKDLTLAMTLDVGTILEKHGVIMNYTRKTDRTLSLQDRVRISNNFKSEFFGSIHINSFSNNTAQGLETFHYPTSAEGKKLATIVQNELVKQGLFTKNRGVKVAHFYVIKNTNAPAMLIELGFIRNKADMDLLINNFEAFAQAIAKAILTWLRIKYIPHEPSRPEYVKGKLNIDLITERVLAQGFMKDRVNYIKINGQFFPVRDILEELGFVVGWEDRVITADLSTTYRPDEENFEVLLLGNKININGIYKDHTNLAKIKDNYISIRDIFEQLGLNVGWDSKNKIVIVEK